MNEKITLGEALNIMGQLKRRYQAVEKIDQVLALAQKMDGLVKEGEVKVAELKRQEQEAYTNRIHWERETERWEGRATAAKAEAEKYAPILAQYEAFKAKLDTL